MKKSLIIVKDKNVFIESKRIAEVSGKRHDIVLRKIENLIKDDEDNQLHFVVVRYKDKKGEYRKQYIMNRRSFSILCMGFTGKKALKWKNRFYDAFEQMENFILQQQNHSWQQARIDGKQDRYELTEAIKSLVRLAANSGSNNADRYYESISKMIYQHLFNINKVPINFRDSLEKDSLKQLRMVEWQVSQWLINAITTCEDYHEPYREIKEKLKILVSVIGVMSPNLHIET